MPPTRSGSRRRNDHLRSGANRLWVIRLTRMVHLHHSVRGGPLGAVDGHEAVARPSGARASSIRAACDPTPALRKMAFRWLRTVCGLTKRRCAMVETR